jgi:hypothetical protein
VQNSFEVKMKIMLNFIKIHLLLFLFVATKSEAQTFETNLRKAYAILTIAQEHDRQAAEKLEDIKTRRIRAEEDLIDAMEANQLPKKEKVRKENNIKLLKKQESDVAKIRKTAADYLTLVVAMVKTDDKKRTKFVQEYEKKNDKLPDEVTPQLADNDPVTPQTTVTESSNTIPITENPIPQQAASVVVSEPSKQPKTNKKEPKKPSKKDNKVISVNSVKQIIPYDSQKDVALNPPSTTCSLVFDGIDNFTQKRKRETQPELLFKHTEDFMRDAMRDKDYITCHVSGSRVQGNYYFLNLTFTIQSKEAQRAFGFLDKGAAIVFKLINGRNLAFYTSKTDIGVLENNTTTYKAQLQISSSDAKLLGVVELDVLRVAWSAGYEDYDIHSMDVMQNIMRCLDAEAK